LGWVFLRERREEKRTSPFNSNWETPPKKGCGRSSLLSVRRERGEGRGFIFFSHRKNATSGWGGGKKRQRLFPFLIGKRKKGEKEIDSFILCADVERGRVETVRWIRSERGTKKNMPPLFFFCAGGGRGRESVREGKFHF